MYFSPSFSDCSDVNDAMDSSKRVLLAGEKRGCGVVGVGGIEGSFDMAVYMYMYVLIYVAC